MFCIRKTQTVTLGLMASAAIAFSSTIAMADNRLLSPPRWLMDKAADGTYNMDVWCGGVNSEMGTNIDCNNVRGCIKSVGMLPVTFLCGKIGQVKVRGGKIYEAAIRAERVDMDIFKYRDECYHWFYVEPERIHFETSLRSVALSAC